MSHTILELWCGNIVPCESRGTDDAEIKHLSDLMTRNRETLCEALSSFQLEIHQKYVECLEEYQMRMREQAFHDGFCLGCKLISEALT